MAIVINGSGTITGISTGGLPDGIVDDGTLATSAVTSTKIADGTITNADINASAAIAQSKTAVLTSSDMPVGSVLQVVTGATTTGVSNSTNTYVDTGITATITPKFTSSKILVIIGIAGLSTSNQNLMNRIALQTLRGSTVIDTSLANLWTQTTMYLRSTAVKSLTDSPNTTSAVTYKMKFMNEQNVALVKIQTDGNSGVSTISLFEIAV